jgi:WD40 repeat protein
MPSENAPTDSVEHITFHPKRSVAAVSYVDNKVCLWDTTLQRLRTTLKHPDGVVRSSWAGDSEHHLVTCCLDGIVRVWDVDQNEIIAEVTGHHDQLLDMRISENLVVTADDSGVVKVFRIS